MEEQISNSVIVERIHGLKTLIETKFDSNAEEHARIEEQVKKTNGRVTVSEDWQAKYENLLNEITEERKNRKSNIGVVGWELIKMGIVGLVVLAGNAIWLAYFTK
jgi:hypothetical protein